LFCCLASCSIWPVKCQYIGVIAKAILDMLTQSPATSGSATKSSGSPLQAFSDSLLAASKSFLQGSSSSDSSVKTGRRQRSASDDAQAPNALLANTTQAGVAVLPQISSQQIQATTAKSIPLQGSLDGSTTDAKSSSLDGQFIQSLAAFRFTGNQSSTAQASINPTSLAIPASVPTSFNTVEVPNTGTTAIQSKPTQDLSATELMESQPIAVASNMIPTKTVQANALPSSVATVQVPQAETATTQLDWTGVAGRPAETAASTGLASSDSNVAQSRVAQANVIPANADMPVEIQSSVAPTETNLVQPTIANDASSSFVSKFPRNATVGGQSEAESYIVSGNDSQPVVSQSNVNPVEMRQAAPATIQSGSPATPSKSDWNVPVARMPESESSVAEDNADLTHTALPANRPSSYTSAQISFTGSTLTPNASTATATPSNQNAPAAEPMEAQPRILATTIAPESTVLSVAERPNFTTAQTPVAESATIQNVPIEAARQMTWNAAPEGLAKTQTSIIPVNIPQATNAQPTSADVQADNVGAATSDVNTTRATNHPEQDAPLAGWIEIQSSVVPVKVTATQVSQPVAAQANANTAQAWTADSELTQLNSTTVANLPQQVTAPEISNPVKTPVDEPATTQVDSTDVTSQPVQNATNAGWFETQLGNAPAKISVANLPQQVTAPVISNPVKTPVDEPTTNQVDSTGVTSQPVQNAAKAGWFETQSSVAPAKIAATNNSQTVAVQSSVNPIQTPFNEPATIEVDKAPVTNQPVQIEVAVGEIEIQSSITPATAPQVKAIQSNVASTQAPVAQPAKTPEFVQAMPVANATANRVTQAGTTSPVAENDSRTNFVSMQSSIAPAEAPQAAPIQSKNLPIQAVDAQSAAPQKTNAVVAGPFAQDLPTTKSPEAESDVVIAATPEPTAVQPQFAAVQMPAATTQVTANIAAPQPTENLTPTAPVNTARTSATPKTTELPAEMPLNLSQLRREKHENSAQLPTARISGTTAPTAATPASGSGDLNAPATVDSSAAQVTDNSTAPDSPSKAVLNTTPSAPEVAVANDPVVQASVPVVRETMIASTKVAIAPETTAAPEIPADPQPTALDMSSSTTTVSTPGGIANQLSSLPLSGQSIGSMTAKISGMKTAPATKQPSKASSSDKGSNADRTGTKKSAEPASDAELNSASQDAASSSNPGQDSSTPQAQDATPIVAGVAAHAAAMTAPMQNPAAAASTHTSSTSTSATEGSVNSTDNGTHAAKASPLAPPAIHAARLIQSMGQSEMRVGMRSNEFGNISISTSSNKDQVSAQISLEHGELARTLATHLPEMQARLGGEQTMDVRIDMNGAAAGQGTGSFGGMSNGSGNSTNSGSRQQTGGMAASRTGGSVAEQQFSPVAAALPTGYARLDIRV